jgi:hypothetical protein
MQITRTFRRVAYSAGYLAMAAAGFCAWRWPSPSLAHATGGEALLIVVWDIFLVVGGLTAGLGAAVDRWLGEYVGLPLLAAVFAVYGLSSLASAKDSSRAGAAILIAVALLLLARWADVGDVRRVAAQSAKARAKARNDGAA